MPLKSRNCSAPKRKRRSALLRRPSRRTHLVKIEVKVGVQRNFIRYVEVEAEAGRLAQVDLIDVQIALVEVEVL